MNNMNNPLKSQKGFTLTEIMVVLAMIAIMTSIAVPNIVEWLPRIRVNSCARELASEMQLARMMAVRDNNNYIIIFNNAANDTYIIIDDDNNNNVQDGAETSRTINISNSCLGIGYGSAGNPAGVLNENPIVNISYNTIANTVIFFPRGTINQNGAVYLIPADDIAPGRQNRMRAVSTTVAGRIRVWSYDGNNNWN